LPCPDLLIALLYSYDKPPLYDVTIEEFETSALDRLRVLAEIESSAARNRTWDETKAVTRSHCLKYLPLSSPSQDILEQEDMRRRDHLGHFVLRLAFCRSCVIIIVSYSAAYLLCSEDLRRRFIKAETTLFKVRFESDINSEERRSFLSTRNFNWIAVHCFTVSAESPSLIMLKVDAEEKKKYEEELLAASYQGYRNEQDRMKAFNTDRFYKV
jgi:DNA primase large subunit